LDPALAAEDYCYVTTVGRVTGRPHEIEIWFALEGSTLYILAGGGHRSDWVKNGIRAPEVSVRIAGQTYEGRLRVVAEKAEDALARRLLLAKYGGSSSDLSEWGRTALPVAIDLPD
jgi:deazaflavin-dependent oxidoreductase (nitroreductase family)